VTKVGRRTWRTYLQTCPDIGALVPITLLGGNGEDTEVAGVAGPSRMGFASSREW
jgi:hypothetical protein